MNQIDCKRTLGCSIFTDAKVVVDDLRNGKPFPWTTATTLGEIELLSRKNNVTVHFVSRQFNSLAHNLAQWGAFSNFVGVLSVDSLPPTVANLL